MKLPRILDLFCGAGGAAMGLHQAGFEVVGVDIKPQPHYPFEFHQADALTYPLEGFDCYWASPPCQRYTQMLNHGLTDRQRHPDFIDVVRKQLTRTTLPWIIENVAGSPLIHPVMLCGEMFDLRVTRHRFFESSVPLTVPLHPTHKGKGIRNQHSGGYYYRVYGHETGKAEWGKAMGIDWMRSCELTQAIPPAYSKFLGDQLINHVIPLSVKEQ